MRQTIARQIDQGAAAQIHDEGPVVTVGERRQFRFGHRGGEALDGVVAGVDLHQQRRARPDRLLEVAQMGAVGCSDLAQFGAGAAHDVGHPEGAADLDQLTARDQHLLARRQGVEQQEDRCRVVVDQGRGLGAGQLAQQGLDDVVAVAASAALQVVFQRAGVARGGDQRRDRFIRQGRAAQVGMQHGAGEVVDRAQTWAGLLGQPRVQLGDQGRFGQGRGVACAGADGLTPLGEQIADGGGGRLSSVLGEHGCDRRMAQQTFDRGQAGEWTGGGGRVVGHFSPATASGSHRCARSLPRSSASRAPVRPGRRPSVPGPGSGSGRGS